MSGACLRIGASRVTRATGPDARRGSEGIAMRYGKESQRSRWPRAAEPSGLSRGRFRLGLRETAERSAGETRRAQGGCGTILRQNSSPMLQHRIRRPSLSGTCSRAACRVADSVWSSARPPSEAQANPPVRGRTPICRQAPIAGCFRAFSRGFRPVCCGASPGPR